jgi:hypothetical protein
MQLHYVVFYDTDTQKWGVEFDTSAYFPDGNVFDNNFIAAETGHGWFHPASETPMESALDDSLVRLLGYIVDTWPAPGVVSHA